MSTYYELDSAHTDPARIRAEREKAKVLRKSAWWQARVNAGRCEYCDGAFKPSELTLDHIVPLARGGLSVRGNVAPACRACNAAKKLDTPVDRLFAELEAAREPRA